MEVPITQDDDGQVGGERNVYEAVESPGQGVVTGSLIVDIGDYDRRMRGLVYLEYLQVCIRS